VRIDAKTNTVVLGSHDDLAVTGLTATRTNWLCDVSAAPFACQVQTRYNSRPAEATVHAIPESDQLRVHFHTPQYGVAPGQAVVCYEQSRVLGGGWIESTCGRETVTDRCMAPGMSCDDSEIFRG
jgi:tRNA-specific 2-thiouridylase